MGLDSDWKSKDNNVMNKITRQSPRLKIVVALFILSATLLSPQISKVENNEDLRIEIGRSLYFDKTLGNPDGQACSVCHAPKTSFSDPDHIVTGKQIGRAHV